MHVFELTRALIDIDSVTPNEGPIGDYLYEYVRPLAEKYDGKIEKMPVAEGRNNVYATWGSPKIVFSTHMDTVPPFIASSEDDEHIWGRGASDTHGIAASMLKAVEALLRRRRARPRRALRRRRGSRRYRRRDRQSKPTRRSLSHQRRAYRKPTRAGDQGRAPYRAPKPKARPAHSAYVELGESAIDKLLDNLESLRKIEWPVDAVLGESTLNIGTISGGEAANVIPDRATASIAIRVVSDLEELKKLALSAFDDRVRATVASESPAVHLKSLPGFETSIVKYATDIPKLTNWGQPLLIGPGTIHVAHTLEERVPKKQLLEAVDLYRKLFKQLRKTT